MKELRVHLGAHLEQQFTHHFAVTDVDDAPRLWRAPNEDVGHGVALDGRGGSRLGIKTVHNLSDRYTCPIGGFNFLFNFVDTFSDVVVRTR